MIGFSIPNTRADVMNNLEIAPDETLAYLRQLYDNRKVWWTVKQLYNEGDTYLDEEGVEQTRTEDETYAEDETHRILSNEDSPERYAQEYITDPNWYCSKKLGLDEAEVAALLEG
jgi:hypothetical protein